MPEQATVFEKALAGEARSHTPIWIMRQAGRYLPEYRALREKVDFLTATKTPELAAEITLQPMRRFQLDAAILFSDIMTPLEGMGVPIEFKPGPVIERPIRSAADAAALRPLDPEETVPFVAESVKLVRAELRPDAALIGFAGAPFTLFCYLVEGGGSKEFMEPRRFLRAEPEAATGVLRLLGESMARYLLAQAKAGANALMLFDSWVGLLGIDLYRQHVLPVLQETVAAIRAGTDLPLIYFPNGGSHLLEAVGELDVDVVGVDWTLPLSGARAVLGSDRVLQGNLDPSALYAPRTELASAADVVLEEARGSRGHVFNLGHGINRFTDPDQVAFLVDHVHERSLGTHGA
jgi:uroporphyrinogen decarboxylase